MRTSLLHPLADRRRRRHRRGGRHASSTHIPKDTPYDGMQPGKPGAPLSGRATAEQDFTAQRVREAGGPLDEACYPCSCGYFFIAPVSTSVACPHCGATQAW